MTYTDSQVYPGKYVPLMNEKEVAQQAKHFRRNKAVQHAAQLSESQGTFKIELVMPGIKREEIMMASDQDTIFICVPHQKQAGMHQKSPHSLKRDFGGFNRQIKLPPNADTQFVSAEYKSGTLHIHVPKSSKPLKNPHTQIAVY